MLAKLRGVSIKALLRDYRIDAPDIVITDLVLDSREVAIHKGFVAIKGHNLDGRDFIPQAVSLGAKVIIAEADSEQQHGDIAMRKQSVIIGFYQLAERLSELAAQFYGHPANDMDMVAVTGTNGKTSTVQLITQLRHLAGDKSASIGTLGAGIYQPSTQLPSTLNTTPDAVQMQRLLAEHKKAGVKQVALEASSHALVQGRISHLRTQVAVFTNLSRDHLDYHGSMAEYARAKRLLMQQPGLERVVLNFDDRESEAWLAALPEGPQVTLYSLCARKSDIPANYQYCLATDVQYTDTGCLIHIDSSWGQAQMRIALLGKFNVSNLLAAICVQLHLGQPLSVIAANCGELHPVTGRMEIFANPAGANVIVDYAHTPDALQQALTALRKHCDGQLYCVFGCGGDRDQGKRSLMGEVAERLADNIILTNDNSRSEAPQNIIDDILSGLRDPQAVTVQLDRADAIAEAMHRARPRDLILVAGKGHEDYQIIGDSRLPYNERDTIKNLLKGNAK